MRWKGHDSLVNGNVDSPQFCKIVHCHPIKIVRRQLARDCVCRQVLQAPWRSQQCLESLAARSLLRRDLSCWRVIEIVDGSADVALQSCLINAPVHDLRVRVPKAPRAAAGSGGPVVIGVVGVVEGIQC